MKRLRISGLVGLAKRVRQELAGPVSPERLAQLRQEVAEAITGIERIFHEEHVRVESLPAPSRKALQFLKGLNWGAVVTEESPRAGHRPPESVSFRGLQRYFDDLLDRLARAAQPLWRGRGDPKRDESRLGRAPTGETEPVGTRTLPALASRGHLGGPQRGILRWGPLCLAPATPDVPPGPKTQGQDALATKEQGPDALATPEQDARLEEVYETIVSDSANIEEEIRTKNIRPEQLKSQARELRGWFAYFAQRENFDRYCAAVRRAEPVFRATCPWPAGKVAAVLVHFRPMQGLYRVRGCRDTIVVDLPTPMICFDQNTLRAVAQIAFKKGGDRRALHDAATGEAHRRIDAAIELLGGVVDQMRGLHRDLAESFDRVNAAYFDGSLNRPRLVWSRSFATRKYGHYDHAHDTVVINAALDQAGIPEYVVDFVVYHELLHRELGITWKRNRIAAHTPELAERERQFQQYDQAKAVLRKLASER
jgi:hypothetical protein